MYAPPRAFRFSSQLITHIDKKRKTTNEDDDFIVPDNASDSDVASIPSEGDRRSTSRSSARSASGLDSDEDEDEEAPKRKKAVSKPSGKSRVPNAAVTTASSLPFLTAAERSTQDKKSEKKNVEKPFGFLQDIRDKDGVRPGQPGYDPRTIYVPKSSWAEFTPFEKQV
jgi:DNA mismatch repair protein MSH6